jgi:hypothetical protein
MKIDLKYVAMSPIEIQVMNADGSPVFDEGGNYVMHRYEVGDEVDVTGWRPSKVGSLVEYRRLLPVAADTSGTVTPALSFHSEGLAQVSPSDTLAVTSYAAFPKHAGGPWYELSNGERVKGKFAAEKAEALIV